MVYDAILEVLSSGNEDKKRVQRLLDTITDIRNGTIEGKPVAAVFRTNTDQPMFVRHFRYDRRCEYGCAHAETLNGVWRYFGIILIIAGDIEIRHIYKPNSYSELNLYGKEAPFGGKRHTLPRVG